MIRRNTRMYESLDFTPLQRQTLRNLKHSIANIANEYGEMDDESILESEELVEAIKELGLAISNVANCLRMC